MEGVVRVGVSGDNEGDLGGGPRTVGRSCWLALSVVRGSSGRAPPVEVVGVVGDCWVGGRGMVRAVGVGSPRTSLTSVQCEPLPVKPAGQGPQRAPLAVSVQATPGKQEPDAQ